MKCFPVFPKYPNRSSHLISRKNHSFDHQQSLFCNFLCRALRVFQMLKFFWKIKWRRQRKIAKTYRHCSILTQNKCSKESRHLRKCNCNRKTEIYIKSFRIRALWKLSKTNASNTDRPRWRWNETRETEILIVKTEIIITRRLLL